MTTTNQAFIKAYRRDTAEPAAPPVPRGSFSRPAAPIAAASVESYATEAAEREVIRSAASAPPDTAAEAVSVGAEPPARRPLSAFAGQPAPAWRPATPRLAQRPPHASRSCVESFHPGTTIASFEWPRVCRALWRHPRDPLHEAVGTLAARADQAGALIGMMGLFPGRGCTTMLLALSAPLAARGRRVAVVDGSFFRPQLAPALGIEPLATWHDVLTGGAAVGDAVIRALDDGVDLLPLEPRLCDARQLAASAQASITAGVLRHAYDATLIDLGAFFDPESQPVALELVRNLRLDAVLAVAGPQPADPRDLATLADTLAPGGCELLGTIVNRIVEPHGAPQPQAARCASATG